MDIESLIAGTIGVVPDPYMGPPNLILTYKVQSGAIVIDSMGNQTLTTQDVIVKASVTKDRTPVELEQAGADLSQIKVKGRLVEPRLMPSNITLEMMADAELDITGTGSAIKGTFRLIPTVQSRFAQVDMVMGSKVSGIFYAST